MKNNHEMKNVNILANVEDEEDLLTCVLCNPRSIKKIVDVIKPEHFYRDRHSTLYNIMVKLYQQGKRCTADNIWDEVERRDIQDELKMTQYDLRGWIGRANSLQPINEYAERIMHKAMMRRLRDAGTEIVGLAYAEDDDAVERAEKLIYGVAMGAGSKTMATLGDALDRYISDLEQRIDERKQGIARGIPTGFIDVDRAMGGMQPGALYTLGALTGLGKTAWSLNVAMNVVQHSKHALFFSLEMKEGELVQRIVSAETIIDQTFLRDADIDEAQLRAIKERARGLRNCNLEIDDSSYLLSDIKSKIRQVHARAQLDLVVLDYLQLVKTSADGRARHETRTEEIATLSREMKRLAHELNIPILILAQLNRAVDHRQSKEPTLADINESGAIARDSDVVLFLYAVEEELEKAKQCVPYHVSLKIAKNRNGRVGEVVLQFNPRITKFRTMEYGNDEN
jgi:replicative DNA helicase